MPYTLGQAAKATGISKPTLSRAIKSGKLSGQRQENGSYLIDPAELHRVFPPVSCSSNETGDMKQHEPPPETALLQGRLEVMAELLRQIENERDDLRRRLDRSEEARERDAAELRRMTLLLTHERKPPPDAPQTPVPEAPATKEQERQASEDMRPVLTLSPLWPFFQFERRSR